MSASKNFDTICEYLAPNVKEWILGLEEKDIANIITSVYHIPKIFIKPEIPIIPSVPESPKEYPVDLGLYGENRFEDICSRLPRCYTLINTAKIGHKADFILKYQGEHYNLCCLIDVKNYRNTVPKKEIDKFYEDIKHGNYNAGLIISYKSPFTGIKEGITIREELFPTGKIPIMFLSNMPDETLHYCIETLFLYARGFNKNRNTINEINHIIEHINDTLVHSGNTRKLLLDMQTSLNKNIAQCQEQLISLEIKVKESLHYLGQKIDNSTIEQKQTNENIIGMITGLNWASIKSDKNKIFLYHENINCVLEKLKTKTKALLIPNQKYLEKAEDQDIINMRNIKGPIKIKADITLYEILKKFTT
jgi:hypothetical protein